MLKSCWWSNWHLFNHMVINRTELELVFFLNKMLSCQTLRSLVTPNDVKIDTGNGLLSDGTKSLPKTLLTSNYWGCMTWEQFRRECRSYISVFNSIQFNKWLLPYKCIFLKNSSEVIRSIQIQHNNTLWYHSQHHLYGNGSKKPLEAYRSGGSPKVAALFSAANFSSNIIELLQLHDTN